MGSVPPHLAKSDVVDGRYVVGRDIGRRHRIFMSDPVCAHGVWQMSMMIEKVRPDRLSLFRGINIQVRDGTKIVVEQGSAIFLFLGLGRPEKGGIGLIAGAPF